MKAIILITSVLFGQLSWACPLLGGVYSCLRDGAEKPQVYWVAQNQKGRYTSYAVNNLEFFTDWVWNISKEENDGLQIIRSVRASCDGELSVTAEAISKYSFNDEHLMNLKNITTFYPKADGAMSFEVSGFLEENNKKTPIHNFFVCTRLKH